MQKQSDTIVAVSTPAGEGAIGIVRISGSGAFVLSDAVFRRKAGTRTEKTELRKLFYGTVIDNNGERVDDGFVVFMRGPGSYTGEDSVEIFCHGGVLVTSKVLEAVLKAGASLAAPGEFTQRAFVNGKLDLTQAEAVIDVIKASTDGALRSARFRLNGSLSVEINSIKESLVAQRVRVEVLLDFPEDELEDFPKESNNMFTEIVFVVNKAAEALKKLLATYDEGRVLRDGLRVLILGRPNVGKSSLLNILLKAERAIVTHLPGTTRDLIEEPINIRSIPVRLIDTAGLRETADLVESIGIEAARAQIDSADIVLYVTDLTDPKSFSDDTEIVSGLKEKRVLILGNKSDIAPECSFEELQALFAGHECVATSTLSFKSGSSLSTVGESSSIGRAGGVTGIAALEEAIFRLATGRDSAAALAGAHGSAVITTLRHKRSIASAIESLTRALKALANSPLELAATDLLMAVDFLGEITGEVTTDEILSKIFSDFCIGK